MVIEPINFHKSVTTMYTDMRECDRYAMYHEIIVADQERTKEWVAVRARINWSKNILQKNKQTFWCYVSNITLVCVCVQKRDRLSVAIKSSKNCIRKTLFCEEFPPPGSHILFRLLRRPSLTYFSVFYFFVIFPLSISIQGWELIEREPNDFDVDTIDMIHGMQYELKWFSLLEFNSFSYFSTFIGFSGSDYRFFCDWVDDRLFVTSIFSCCLLLLTQ